MKFPALLPFFAAVAFLLPAAAAAEEPESVYAKFHHAAMGGDLDETLKYAPAQRRAEMQGASAATREAALRLVQFMMPRAFRLENRTMGSRGRATLIVSGPWEGGGAGMRTVYGTIRMVIENGEWKVAESNWSEEKPATLAAPKPAAPSPAEAAAAPAKGPQAVGSAAPGHKLGEAKPECVYKPVMSAEDIERCR
jgi:hypothetical protein